MREDILTQPVNFLKARLTTLPNEGVLREYQMWWEERGRAISEAVDRQVTPPCTCSTALGSGWTRFCFPPNIGKCCTGVTALAWDAVLLLNEA